MLHVPTTRCVAACLVLASSAAAQVELEWDHAPQVPLPYRLEMGEALPDPAGGWYVTGIKTQFSFGAEAWLPVDALLMRYDAAGTLMGTQSLGAESGTYPFLVDPSGGFWTVLYTAGNATLRRFDSAGVELVSIPMPASLGVVTEI